MQMMLCGKNLEYVIEDGYKEGYNGIDKILPPATVNSDNPSVSSIIASLVHEENYAMIAPCQDSAKRMWRALTAAHQNNTSGGRYMYLCSMMTMKTDGGDDVSKLITTMDVVRQRLLNVCPEGNVLVDNIYVSSLISALPESWTSVTGPLELQAHITPHELKSVLRGHIVKLKNRDSTTITTSSTSLYASVPPKKGKNKSGSSCPECDYCNYRGHLLDTCHKKQLDDQRKEIDALEKSLKSSTLQKSAKVTHVSDTKSDTSINEVPSAKKTLMAASRVKFSRVATQSPK